MSDLIVDEDSLRDAANYLKQQGENLNTGMKLYIDILTRVNEEGIISGKTADALKNYIQTASKLNGLFATVSERASNEIDAFLKDINEKDTDV